MGMFGAMPSGMFGQGFMPPGYNPQQIPQQPPQPMSQGQQAMQQGMMAREPHGFNKPGGWAERLGALGGVFLNAAGIHNDALQQFQQLQQQREEDQRKAQLAEAARYAPQHIGDNIVSMQPDGSYKTLYAGPEKQPEAPQIVRLQQIYDDPNTPPSIRATVKAAIDAQTDPVITTPGGGMTLRSTVAGQLSGGSSGPPPAAIEMLRKDPSLLPQFEQKYGPGSAQRYLGAGGPTASPSGTFR